MEAIGGLQAFLEVPIVRHCQAIGLDYKAVWESLLFCADQKETTSVNLLSQDDFLKQRVNNRTCHSALDFLMFAASIEKSLLSFWCSTSLLPQKTLSNLDGLDKTSIHIDRINRLSRLSSIPRLLNDNKLTSMFDQVVDASLKDRRKKWTRLSTRPSPASLTTPKSS